MSTKKTDDWVSAVIIDDDDDAIQEVLEITPITKRKPVVSEEVVQDVVQKKKRNIEYDSDSFWKILNNLNNSTLVIFSKKGYFVEKVIKNNKSFNFIVFSSSKRIIDTCYYRANCTPVLTVKFPRNMENFIFNNIKKNLNLVFRKNNRVLLVFANFPKKGSRANTISLIDKKIFLN